MLADTMKFTTEIHSFVVLLQRLFVFIPLHSAGGATRTTTYRTSDQVRENELLICRDVLLTKQLLPVVRDLWGVL